MMGCREDHWPALQSSFGGLGCSGEPESLEPMFKGKTEHGLGVMTQTPDSWPLRGWCYW